MNLNFFQEINNTHYFVTPKDVQLGKIARLDTVVTVIDALEFKNNLKNIQSGEDEDSDSEAEKKQGKIYYMHVFRVILVVLFLFIR